MTTTQPRQSTALAIIDPQNVPLAAQVFGEDRLQLLAEQVGRGWKEPPTTAELEVIALICQRNRLDIFAKPPQIHFVKRWDSKLGREVMTPQTSIDGMRLVASRSRDYLGPAGTQWCGDDGVWKDVWLASEPPRAAKVGVIKRGRRDPMYAVALWDEWVQTQDEYDRGQKTGRKVLAPFWKTKPAHMLAKTAEMIVLKQAFPAETDDLQIAHLEELHRLEMPARAAEYDRIYGADEDHAFAELPAPAPGREVSDQSQGVIIESDGRMVNATSGEVIVDKPEPEPAVVTKGPAEPAGGRRGMLLEGYGALLSRARNAGIVADAAPWVLRSDTPEVAIIAKGKELRAMLAQATVAEAATAAPQAPIATDPDPDLDPGSAQEFLEEAVPEFLPGPAEVRSALWQENRRLNAEAAKRGIEAKTLNARTSDEAIRAANEALEQRLADIELDQQLNKQQQQAFS